MTIEFAIGFYGSDADQHAINFYDAAQALVGFQRSLALVTHFVINNEIITHATALEGAEIYSTPPEGGSWKTTAIVVTALWTIGTAPKDSQVGHVISSVYDYVVSETLGVHVDYDESLGQTLEKHRAQKEQASARESQLDSLIEKCEVPIKNMHRPVVKSATANEGKIVYRAPEGDRPIGPPMDFFTWEYIDKSSLSDTEEELEGWVSSYNINTFKGRVYLSQFGRPVPFILAEDSRNATQVAMITTSLNANAKDRLSDDGRRYFKAYRNVSSTGRLKGIYVVHIASYSL